MNAPAYAIDVRGVTKKFGSRTVVNDIAMQVRPGEIYGFLGPNGSGKTTFLRMLCGLLKPDGGEGSCSIMISHQSAEIKKHVGYMTQRFSFYEDLSIEENLDFIARSMRCRRAKSAVDKSLERLGMVERRKQLAGRFPAAETTPRARGLSHHEPQLLLWMNHGGRGPQGAPRFLGGDPPARRWRVDRPRHDALHGRGRALSPVGLHRLWQSARQRLGR